MATNYRTRQARKHRAKLHRHYLPIGLVTAISPLLLSAGTDIPLAEIVIEDKTATIPDITQMTLDSFDLLPGENGGVADVLVLGDLSGFFDLRDMTLGSSVAHWTSHERKEITLDKYTFLSEMTIAEVANMGGLYSEEVGRLPIVEKAFTTFLKHPVLTSERRLTLSQFLERYPEIGSIKLGFLELSEYSHTDIPSFLSTPITKIPNWQELKVSSIVGLREIAIHQDIDLDGEIVTLSTSRIDNRLEVQLTQGFQKAVWSEEIEDSIQPFQTFFLRPEIVGESIKIHAYFRSCSNEQVICNFIGPFKYQDYKKGDNFYVSSNDWDVITKEESSIEFKREPSLETHNQTTDRTFDENLLFKIIGITIASIVGLGTPCLIWLLSRRKKIKT